MLQLQREYACMVSAKTGDDQVLTKVNPNIALRPFATTYVTGHTIGIHIGVLMITISCICVLTGQSINTSYPHFNGIIL